MVLMSGFLPQVSIVGRTQETARRPCVRTACSNLLMIPLFLAIATAAHASAWYVNGARGSDSNNCTSAQTACKTIGHAIALSASGDSIIMAPATYQENPVITINLSLLGSNTAKTIIDGGYITHTVAILDSAAVVTLSKVTIRNGSASGGGGILNWGTLTINNCTISGNLASSTSSAAGAGIFNYLGTVTINNSTLSGNQGSSNFFAGGAICNEGTLVVNNSTRSGNSAGGVSGGGGGGIVNYATATISNSTMSGNSGTPAGGGILNSGGTVTLQNSIIANSTAGGNCSGTMTSNGYNLSSDGTCGFANTGDLNNTNPLLGPLRNNGGPTKTMALSSGSPAIDAGNPGGCTDNVGNLLLLDQRGQPRPDPEDTGGCDMGAYESQTD